MSEYALHGVFINPDKAPWQAKAAFTKQRVPFCRKAWESAIDRLSWVLMPEEDQRSLQQNAFMWGVVLKEISQQAKVNGIGATPDGWHLYFKRKHLGYKFKKTVLPGKTRPSVTKELRSTTDLSVKKMSAYLEAVIAEAVTDFGVMFSERDWSQYKGETT